DDLVVAAVVGQILAVRRVLRAGFVLGRLGEPGLVALQIDLEQVLVPGTVGDEGDRVAVPVPGDVALSRRRLGETAGRAALLRRDREQLAADQQRDLLAVGRDGVLT